MASSVDILMCYLEDLDHLRAEPRLLAWLEAIAAQGYYVVAEEEPFYDRWAEVLRTQSVRPGIAASAFESVRRFSTGANDVMLCTAYSLKEDFRIGVDVYPDEGGVVLSVDDGYFTTGDTGLHKFELWLTLAEATYRTWYPLYGFDYGGSAATVPYTTRQDALALDARCLYNVNLFGPSFVAKLGRERLLSAPAWLIKEFDDGGIMLVPTPYTNYDYPRPPRYTMQAVAQHVGLPSPLK